MRRTMNCISVHLMEALFNNKYIHIHPSGWYCSLLKNKTLFIFYKLKYYIYVGIATVISYWHITKILQKLNISHKRFINGGYAEYSSALAALPVIAR